MGLLRPPAARRLPGSASTAVRSMTAIGHKLERTSRTTCCDASAVSLATETCGLFLSARSCACFSDKGDGAPELACAPTDCDPPVALGTGGAGAVCGIGADGSGAGVAAAETVCAT